MTRRGIRENIFQIVFKAAFNDQEEMEEQIHFTVDQIEKPEEDPDDIVVAEAGHAKEEDIAYIETKSRKILAMLPELMDGRSADWASRSLLSCVWQSTRCFMTRKSHSAWQSMRQ